MRFLKGFGMFWYDFIIGDDWKIAAAVVLALAVTLGVTLTGLAPLGAVTVVGGVLLLAFFVVSLVVDVRR
jgi:Na+/glutamate symporter